MASLARFVVFIAIIVLGFLILIRSLEYFDPTFDKGYLIDKKEVFYGFFSIGLYIHIISSPVLLVLGSILIVIRIEKYRKLHRFLGYGYIFCATFAMISGLILSCYAFGGLISKLNFFIELVI
ncbi:DUF2306 domain-containing protein [Aquimarina algiphila]|uniref:DUF2306 domain-containing protein n=1 Tax=Aquimarina algiphila TaxID=2047982 RepID=UPI00232F95F7|nr:DUF2306 domain-containing protein [Aquimarina algiphila]